MADELERALSQEPQTDPTTADGEAEPEAPEKSGGPFARIWHRIALALTWLRKPEEVGRPLTLQPRGVRSLVLLILGNLVVLVLLASALYRTATTPIIVETLRLPTATATPNSPPVLGPTPTPLGSGGAIAFTLRRNSNADIYALNQADMQLVRLTYNPAEDRDPAWSPDGDYIAFASNRARNWDIYLLDLVSGALIRLTHDPGFDGNPSWSPDGRWIAFESYRRGNLDIYVMSTSGQQMRRITTDSAPNYEPAWSPDSRAIAYTTFDEGNKDIYVHTLDEQGKADTADVERASAGASVVNLTQSPDLDEDTPSWSPDGTKLAYVSGPRGNPSVQVTAFDWDTISTNQAETEIFGAGTSPAWAPDGQSILYAHERSGSSHLVAASTTGWALFHEVYSSGGPIDDLAWISIPLSARVVARAQADAPAQEHSFYLELIQPTPTTGPPYELTTIPNIAGDETRLLSDRVNESFNALRQRVIEETGWDYLGTLSTSWQPMTHTPPSGHSRMSWHVCGRAIGLDQAPYEEDEPQIELTREDVGNVTYWRVFIRAAEQDGSMGEPLREAVWDLNARQEGGRAMVEGGEPKAHIPSGYYVDFTTLASDYGWQRIPSLWRWRYFWPDIRWWEFQKTNGLTWWEGMLEIFAPKEIEPVFGPIPGYEE